jgi:hypothetical protein
VKKTLIKMKIPSQLGHTHLTHGIGILSIQILDDAANLTLEFQLSTFQKVQTGCVDDGKKHAIEARFTNLDACGLDRLGVFGWTMKEAFDCGTLIGRGGGRDLGRFQQEPKE